MACKAFERGQGQDRFDWCLLPAVAPQVGHVQDFHRSEWDCTGWITPGRTPFYLRGSETAVSDSSDLILQTPALQCNWRYLDLKFWRVISALRVSLMLSQRVCMSHRAVCWVGRCWGSRRWSRCPRRRRKAARCLPSRLGPRRLNPVPEKTPRPAAAEWSS